MASFDLTPWTYPEYGAGLVVGVDEKPVAFLASRMNFGDAPRVHGNLIAAAPDMYEALQPLAEEVLATDPIRNEQILRARDALAKAEGRQP